ncbi:MAG: hypothetical protein ABF310_01835 [Paracoccaceae bacterium]|jgi:hypothetical protein
MFSALDVMPAVALLEGRSGDPIGLPEDNQIGAQYHLDPAAQMREIHFAKRLESLIAMIDGDTPSDIAVIAQLEFDADRQTIRALLVLETPFEGLPRLWLAPFGPMGGLPKNLPEKMTLSAQRTDMLEGALYAPYAVGIDADVQVLSATGAAVRLGDVAVGDRLLTRDHGPQEVQ